MIGPASLQPCARHTRKPGYPRHDGDRRYSGRSTKLADTFLGRIYHKLYSHPTRFYGDLQHEGIVNWHKKVKDFVGSFPPVSRLLDLGSGFRPIGKNLLSLDICFNLSSDIVADSHYLPFSCGGLDGVILQMIPEHVADPQLVLDEVYRVLKPGGKLYCEVPFLYPAHD